jgi:hypothetical protein
MAIPYTATGNTKILYHLDGNSTDSSGNANNGSDANVTYTAGGKFGQYAAFNGSSSKIVSGGNVGISGNAARTMIVWTKYVTPPAGDGICGWGEGGTTGAMCMMLILGGYYFFAGYSADLYATTLVNDTNWHCGAFTYDGTTLSIYSDGHWDAETALSLNTTASNFHIGQRPSNDQWSNCNQDEIIVEDRCWSDAEVLAYYNAVAGGSQAIWFMKRTKTLWDSISGIYRPRDLGVTTI